MTDRKPAVLETKRLILREPVAADATYLQPILNNWEIAKWLGAHPSPFPKDGAEKLVARMIKGIAIGEKQIFMMCLKDQPSIGPIGSLGLHWHEDEQWGFGYWLGQSYWGRGLTGEAALPVVRFAMETLAATRLVSTYFKGNDASARILQRCGFDPGHEGPEWCEARGKKIDAVELELTEEKWVSQATEPSLHSPPIC